MPVLVRCKSHRQSAGWRCSGCGEPLCPDCVATKRVQIITDLDVCLRCGELAEPLTQHRSEERSFVARLPRAFLWPLSKAGLLAIAGVAVTRAVLSYLPGIGWALSFAAFAAVCFAFIRSTARGSDDFEVLDYGDFFGDLVVPGVKAAVGAAIVWVPALIWLLLRHSNVLEKPYAVLTDPVIWLLLVAGVLYAPMAILVGAAGGSLLGMLSPLHVARNALRLGRGYFITVGLLGALFVPWFALQGVGSMLNFIPIPFVPRVLDHALACYVPFVAARIMGLLLYTHGDQVGYGLETEYRVPLLKEPPRGVAPELSAEAAAKPRRAPIELEPEPEPAPAPAEARVERITELDPDKLPPLKVE